MSTEELRARGRKAIAALPPRVLEKVVELLEEVQAVADRKDEDELIQRIINENRDLFLRLAQYDKNS